MKSQETLSKIMELLNLQDEVKLESMKLENGTTIEAEEFTANQEVFIVTEDERIALPVGEYELEDGRILVVAEEGVIAEMRDAGEPEEAPAEEEEVEANEEEMGYATKEELSAAVAEMKEMIEEIKAMMSPKEEEMSEEVAEEPQVEEPKEELAEEVVEEEVEMSADEPAAKPIKHNPETKTADMHKFSKGARKDTLSRIFDKLN
jgi:signal recognition particle GTPase